MSRERYTAARIDLARRRWCSTAAKAPRCKFATCCRPIPGDDIVGYLGRGEGLVVHTDDCVGGQTTAATDSERFIAVDWSDEPARAFETGLLVTVTNGKGVLARVASALASAEADITHVDMARKPAQDATDLRFGVAVRDRVHLASVMRSVKRTPRSSVHGARCSALK